MQNTIVFKAGDDNCLQVFHVDSFDMACPASDGACDIEFDSSLDDKTVLINVASPGGSVSINDIGAMHVNTRTISSILWNFYGDDIDVTLCGGFGGPQFAGSVLIPHGNLEMKCPGLDGRVMVGGNVVQNKAHSEFHA